MAHRLAMTAATARARRALPGYAVVLLAGQTVARTDDRITRHLRLWRSLERSGVRLPRGPCTDESCVAAADGLRYFGAVPIEEGDDAQAMDVMRAEPASTLVAIPSSAVGELGALLAAGWTAPADGPSLDVVEWAAPRGGVVLCAVGGFDDPESGVLAVGAPEVVMRLARDVVAES